MTIKLLNPASQLSKPKPDVMQAIKEHNEYLELVKTGYEYEAAHEYTDKDGKTQFFRVRLKHPGSQKKWIRPVYFNGSKWVWNEPEFLNGLKPLYNLHEIIVNPSAKIWICEGEWAADHLNKFFKEQNVYGDNIATTSGSANGAAKADWSSLANHQIIIWPDNDDSGSKYAKEVEKKLRELACQIEMVDVESLDLPHKGDVVDWLNKNQNVELAEFESIPVVSISSEFEPLFDIAEASVANLLDVKPPSRKYLLWQCLPLGKVGLLIGMGGVRKSQLALQMQISIATGKPLCRQWPIGTEGATLGLYAEEEIEELQRRLYCFTEGMSEADKTLIRERVLIKSMVGINCQMISKENPYETAATELVFRLIETTKQLPNLKLIVIDPLSRFYGGDENNSADATRFIEACETLAIQTGATVLIVHHVNKASIGSSESSQAAVRGSSAFTDGVRWQMNLNVMSAKDAVKCGIPESQRKSYVSAEVTKNNYAPPQSEAVWLELTAPHGILQLAKLSTSADNKAEDIISKIIMQVEKDAAKGNEFSKSGFAKEYGGTSNIFKIGDKGLRGLIEQAIEKGKLVLIPPKIATPNVKDVLAVPSCNEIESPISKEEIIGKL